MAEQKQLLKKAGITIKRKTPFKIHEVLVACSDKENRLSKKVDALLNRKFAVEIERMMGGDEAALLETWNECFEAGEYEGALWAAVTCPGLSPDTLHEIFGAVHMAMHGTAEDMRKLKTRVAFHREAAAGLQKKFQKARSESRALKRENRRLKTMETERKSSISSMEAEKGRLEEECRRLKDGSRLSELEQKVSDLEAERDALLARETRREAHIDALEKDHALLTEALKRDREALEHFKVESRRVIDDMARMNRCDANCPSFDLCRKRILMVGGL
ncbi:MAG: hypothetical protein PVG49_08180, partial [Desulfobacteraceae bacterium]